MPLFHLQYPLRLQPAATVKIPTCRSMPRGRWRAISCAAMSKKGIGRLIWVQRLRRLPKDGLSMRFPWPRWKRRSATAVCRLPNITLCTGVHRLPMRKRPSCCSGFMTIALPITAIRPPLRVLQVNPGNRCPQGGARRDALQRSAPVVRQYGFLRFVPRLAYGRCG